MSRPVTVILDASAILALLLAEPGSEVVARHLPNGLVSAVNYAEVLACTARLCGSLPDARRQVDRQNLIVVPFDAEQAAVVASLVPATRPHGLGLADRACLGLGLVRQLPVLTADRVWAEIGLGVTVRLIR